MEETIEIKKEMSVEGRALFLSRIKEELQDPRYAGKTTAEMTEMLNTPWFTTDPQTVTTKKLVPQLDDMGYQLTHPVTGALLWDKKEETITNENRKDYDAPVLRISLFIDSAPNIINESDVIEALA